MNYIVFDNCYDDNGYIAEALRKESISIEEVYSPEGRYKWMSWLKGAVNVIRKSSSGDTLVFWYDFQGIIAFWLCRMFILKRRFILLNILLKNKSTLRNKIVSRLYKPALMSNRVKSTVTCLEYGEALNRQLAINKSHILLHDVYPFSDKEKKDDKEFGNKVFCGGRNGRDWDLVMKIVQSMPDVKFTLVVPDFVQKSYSKQLLSGNVNLLKDVPVAEFNRLLQESSIVLLPLNTDAPAGLLVIFQAASRQKLVITTHTPVTKEYIDSHSGVLCENNAEQYIKEIRFHLQHPDIAKAKGKALHDKLKSECSKEKYIGKLCNILVGK